MLQVICGALLISMAPIFFKLAHVDPATGGFYRVLIGGLILIICAKLSKQKLWQNWRTFIFTILCGLFFSLDLFFWHKSIPLIGPGLATLLVNLQVFILAFIGIIFFRQRFHWLLLIALPLALIGLTLLIGLNWPQFDATHRLGIYLALLTTVWYASYTLTLRQSQLCIPKLQPLANLGMISLSAAVILGILAVQQQENLFSYPLETWIWLGCLALFCQVIGWLLITRGLPHINIAVAGFLLLFQPAFAFVWDMLLFNRPTTSIEIIGLIITLFAIYLGAHATAKKHS